jgi:hypothetical protein
MDRTDSMLIKLEFDKIIKYLQSRKDLTHDDYMQEIGALRMFIYSLSK